MLNVVELRFRFGFELPGSCREKKQSIFFVIFILGAEEACRLLRESRAFPQDLAKRQFVRSEEPGVM